MIADDLKCTFISFKKMRKRAPFAICIMRRDELIDESRQIMQFTSYDAWNSALRPTEIKIYRMQIGSVV